MRRAIPRPGDEIGLLAAFRRTRRQAFGHGLFVGMIIGGSLAGGGFAGMAVRWGSGGAGPPYPWLWLIVALVVPTAIAALAAVATAGRIGVDADDLGVHSVPPQPRSFGPWAVIADIRAERHRGRTIVALYLESGAVLRLRAPYDGRLLSRDPDFEHKVFTLLNLWETHRNWRKRT